MQNDEPSIMSDKDHAMAREIGRAVADNLIARLKDPDEMEAIVETVSVHAQRLVGRAVLRLFWMVLAALLFLGSWKLGLIDKLKP